MISFLDHWRKISSVFNQNCFCFNCHCPAHYWKKTVDLLKVGILDCWCLLSCQPVDYIVIVNPLVAKTVALLKNCYSDEWFGKSFWNHFKSIFLFFLFYQEGPFDPMLSMRLYCGHKSFPQLHSIVGLPGWLLKPFPPPGLIRTVVLKQLVWLATVAAVL